MKIGVDINLVIEASDYVEAADHQRSVEGLFRSFREAYPGAQLKIRQVRGDAKSKRTVPVRTRRIFAPYEELKA